MTAPFDPAAVTVEQADLSDAALTASVDAWVLAQAGSNPFQRPAWLQAIERATEQRGVMLLARDPASRLVGVLPLTHMRSALFGKAMVSSGFAVDGGVLADGDQVAEALAQAGWALAWDNGCASMELRGGKLPQQGWALKSGTYVGFSRPLARDDEAELLAIPKKHRAELRKALESGLDFSVGRDAAFRAAHYGLFARSVHRLGTPVFPRALFDRVLDAFGDAADIALICKDGKPVSSVLSLWHGDAVMPYWQGAADEARGLRSNELLYFRLMSLARERGFARFDFGRSKVGTGPAAWKKNWGFDPVPLTYAARTADGSAPRDVNPLSPRYRRKVEIWKKLPLPVANLVGPWLARGLG